MQEASIQVSLGALVEQLAAAKGRYKTVSEELVARRRDASEAEYSNLLIALVDAQESQAEIQQQIDRLIDPPVRNALTPPIK